MEVIIVEIVLLLDDVVGIFDISGERHGDKTRGLEQGTSSGSDGSFTLRVIKGTMSNDVDLREGVSVGEGTKFEGAVGDEGVEEFLDLHVVGEGFGVLSFTSGNLSGSNTAFLSRLGENESVVLKNIVLDIDEGVGLFKRETEMFQHQLSKIQHCEGGGNFTMEWFFSNAIAKSIAEVTLDFHNRFSLLQRNLEDVVEQDAFTVVSNHRVEVGFFRVEGFILGVGDSIT